MLNDHWIIVIFAYNPPQGRPGCWSSSTPCNTPSSSLSAVALRSAARWTARRRGQRPPAKSAGAGRKSWRFCSFFSEVRNQRNKPLGDKKNHQLRSEFLTSLLVVLVVTLLHPQSHLLYQWGALMKWNWAAEVCPCCPHCMCHVQSLLSKFQVEAAAFHIQINACQRHVSAWACWSCMF